MVVGGGVVAVVVAVAVVAASVAVDEVEQELKTPRDRIFFRGTPRLDDFLGDVDGDTLSDASTLQLAAGKACEDNGDDGIPPG